jgi:hypothetical protein
VQTPTIKVDKIYPGGTARRIIAVSVSDGTRSVQVNVNAATGVIGWASDWTVDGEWLLWGRNYGPAAYGHTDVVLASALLDMVRQEVK